VKNIESIFETSPVAMPQVRDKIIFAFDVCTLARSSELFDMKVEDLIFRDDGILVVLRRKKAAASRSTQNILVSNEFFGWNLLENLFKNICLLFLQKVLCGVKFLRFLSKFATVRYLHILLLIMFP